MNVLLIEDEWAAAHHMETILQAADLPVRIVAVLETVTDAVNWLRTHPTPDLAFVDIQLADGSSFDIFEQVATTFPIVFTTAYDEYAIRAFRVNSIDYLLKPIDEAAVRGSLQKYHQWHEPARWSSSTLQKLLADLHSPLASAYKSSFLVHYRDRLLPVEARTFAYFYSKNRIVHAVTYDAKTYILEYTLEELEKQLNPSDFYRANRQHIVARKAVVDIAFYFNGRLLLNLTPPAPDRVVVSKARASEFKAWMSQ